MNRRVVFTARAEAQLDGLFQYITAASGAARADAFTSSIASYCERLAQFPERGTSRDDIQPGLRIVGFRRRVAIAFVVEPDAVIVAGIFYGGQDYESVLRDDE